MQSPHDARLEDGHMDVASSRMTEQDRLEVNLEDAALRSEVKMTTKLIIASDESDEPLSQEQVDRLLGLRD